MIQSIDNWLSSLRVDTSTPGEDDLVDIHGEYNLDVFTEHGKTFLVCNKCQNIWSINFSNSEELGDYFSLESITNQDPLLCLNEEEE